MNITVRIIPRKWGRYGMHVSTGILAKLELDLWKRSFRGGSTDYVQEEPCSGGRVHLRDLRQSSRQCRRGQVIAYLPYYGQKTQPGTGGQTILGTYPAYACISRSTRNAMQIVRNSVQKNNYSGEIQEEALFPLARNPLLVLYKLHVGR